MKEIKDCKIIQDLLPNYIDGLTNDQTNEFIKSHLKECNNCPKILENMKKEIDLNAQKSSKQEVNYIKKFKNHLRTLQGILLVILLAFVIVTGRKTAILMDLKDKANQYSTYTNYYMKSTDYGSGLSLTTEVYRKENQYKTIYNSHATHFYKDGVHNVYYPSYDKDFNEILVAKLNSSQEFYPLKPYHCFSQINFLDLLQVATTASITSEMCNRKECYRISFREYSHTVEDLIHDSSYEDNLTGCIIYLNKKTGLPIRIIRPAGRLEKSYNPIIDYGLDGIVDYYYSFGTVTDKPFVEPDASEYIIEEDFLENGED